MTCVLRVGLPLFSFESDEEESESESGLGLRVFRPGPFFSSLSDELELELERPPHD